MGWDLTCFDRWQEVAREVKGLLPEWLSSAKVYVFGSVVRGDYVRGLSDIDIAIVSPQMKQKSVRDRIFALLWEHFFHCPVEFHLFTPEQWSVLCAGGVEYVEI